MPRAIALMRVSTDVQDVARQRTDIEHLTRKYELGIIRTLELVGVSGTAVLDNAQIQQLLADLSRPEVDGIAVSALDRLFRVKHFKDMGILDRFKDLRKTIWSVREGLVEPWTDEGYDKCFLAASRGGAEIRELRRRSMEQKEVYRSEGKHVNGDATLPRGIAYDKATGKWSYLEPDCSRVARMFPLFLDDWSLNKIAAEVGGGWTHKGVTDALRNRIWAFGERVYPANSRREEPLVVKVIDKPLISPQQSGKSSKRQARFAIETLAGDDTQGAVSTLRDAPLSVRGTLLYQDPQP